MSDDPEITELDAKERLVFDSLAREMPLATGAEDATVAALRSEGFFERRSYRRLAWIPRIAASLALLIGGAIAGGFIGVRAAARSSLEAQLVREDLTMAERVLILQRAGSAYVQAAHAYAGATAQTDSTAVEVARQVLLGAAHAVVRSRLDEGMAASLTSVLSDSLARRVSRPAPNASPIIWY